jgi:hypothetical protein
MPETRIEDFERGGVFHKVSCPFRIGKHSFIEIPLEAAGKPMAPWPWH